jgi:hypothetical protein
MIVYRVSPFLPAAAAGTPGSPTYLHKPQTQGRLDNSSHYDIWYLSLTEAGAVGETFASHPTWSDLMFEFGKLPGARFSLHSFQIPDSCPLLDLDDANSLFERALRPTQVVTLNRSVTQSWALKIWNEIGTGGRKWHGVRWWSRHSAEWPVIALWTGTPTLIESEPLSTVHKSVIEAAGVLNRRIVP